MQIILHRWMHFVLLNPSSLPLCPWSPPPLRMPSRGPRRCSATASHGRTNPRHTGGAAPSCSSSLVPTLAVGITPCLPRACVGAHRCHKTAPTPVPKLPVPLLLALPLRTCARAGVSPTILPLPTMKKLLKMMLRNVKLGLEKC